MNRPSHWILGFLAALGGTLWWTGALQDYLSARPAGGEVAARPSPGPVVVRRDTPAPRPTSREIHGRVVGRDGYPVVNARVRVAGEEGQPVSTDERGRFRLAVAGAVHKRLWVEAPGRHAPTLVRGSLDEIDVVLQDALPAGLEAPASGPAPAAAGPTGLLVGEGRVRGPDGSRLAGVRVVVRETGATELTDDTGRFLIALDGGPCTLVAFDGRGGVAVAAAEVPARRQGKTPLPDLTLEPGPTLRGRLLNRDGEPLIDAAVVVETGGVRRATRTDHGGLFSIAGLVAGDCELVVLPHRGYLGLRQSLFVERDANLPDLIVQRPRQEPLRLTVVDRDGGRQPFVHVLADQLAGLCRAYAQADGDGQVALRGLGDGETEFSVHDQDLQPVEVDGFDAGRGVLIVAR